MAQPRPTLLVRSAGSFPDTTFAASFTMRMILRALARSEHVARLEHPRTMFSKFDSYERFMGRWSRLLAPLMVTFGEVEEGDHVLDVGSGTGALAFAIRDATNTVFVTGVDPAREFIAYAAEKGAGPRVQFQIADGQGLPFGDSSFDKTLSMLVMNFIPDPQRALDEMVRVTKPGGIVAAAVWDYSEEMQMLRVFWEEATALDPAIASRDEAHMPLCRSGQLAALWRRKDLQDVQEVPLAVRLHFASFEDYWGPFLLGQGPAGAYAATLPKERQLALEQRLRERLLGDGPDRALELRARAWAVKGSVPSAHHA